MSKLDKRVEEAIKLYTQTKQKFDEYRKHIKELKKEESKNDK